MAKWTRKANHEFPWLSDKNQLLVPKGMIFREQKKGEASSFKNDFLKNTPCLVFAANYLSLSKILLKHF